MRRLFDFVCVLLVLTGCQSEAEKYLVSEIQRTTELANNLRGATSLCQRYANPEKIAELYELYTDPDFVFSRQDFVFDEGQKLRISRQQRMMDSVVNVARTVCENYIVDNSKILYMEDVLVEKQVTYPMYLVKGSKLVVNYNPSGQMAANLYNADARSLVGKYTGRTTETIDIKNTAIYLFELSSATPQYASIELGQMVNSVEEFFRKYNFNKNQVDAGPKSFRAQKIPGVEMKPIFEEPHKLTLRSQLKNLLDNTGQCRSVAALQIPAGATDVLYHLRISTNDDGSGDDGKFFDETYKKYKKIKFLGLPLYESYGEHNGLLRELLNGSPVNREEKAYCNLYVFTNPAQAKKFQENEAMNKLAYEVDYSAAGTQSRNERIPVKGKKTIYLAFENPRQAHEVYIWIEALAIVPKDVYYTEQYTLEQ